ncbi:MAG: polyprenyl diphosphate synthase [Euryarchaeota archaeon]|nr:polyprenyl diphosphate synthase [Euryarchaeota archaeon]
MNPFKIFLSSLLKPVYLVYEKILERRVKKGKIPHHIGIIMDGNRRYAEFFGLDAWKGHSKGADKLEEILDWAGELDIGIITVYAFSTENFERDTEEVEYIMDLFEKKFEEIAENKRIHENGIKVRAIGKLELLPDRVVDAIKKAEKATEGYENKVLNICVAYGGRVEILEAVKKIMAKGISPEEITIEMIKKNLYTSDLPDPDLVIRTGGEVRLSNFLLFQSAYSELFFTEIYFPFFRRIDFLRILREYQMRERRMGR